MHLGKLGEFCKQGLGQEFLSLSLSLSLVSFLFVIHFFNPLNLFTRFSLFLRRKFINSRRFFTKFTRKFTTFINFHFYGLPRSRKRLFAMTAWQKFTTFTNFSQISTQKTFKILKNSTQRNSYERKITNAFWCVF